MKTKTATLKLRLTEEEYAELCRRARKRRTTLANIAREAFGFELSAHSRDFVATSNTTSDERGTMMLSGGGAATPERN